MIGGHGVVARSPLAGLSLWHDTMPGGEWDHPRPRAPSRLEADVAIVGGGFTGLWAAYYLARREPALRIAVLEAEQVGFGASGRNGGWCSALLPMSPSTLAQRSGRDAALATQAEMHRTVDEVGEVARAEDIDCHWAKGGWVQLARSAPQAQRLAADVEDLRALGVGPDDVRWVDGPQARAMADASDVIGALYTPHCAAIHPARLVRGLARAVEARGVTIHEGTRVTGIGPRRVTTEGGTVDAGVVIRATEAFTARLPGQRRTVAPIYSLMVATEPLPAGAFDRIGLRRRETFSDARHMIVYGQRTADDRLAFGGRGAPYHFASSVRADHDRDDAVHTALAQTLRGLFPVVADAAITHRWGGAVAAARDWWCSVGFDRDTGLAWAGGYVGDGVATSNLAGRILADLVSGVDSPLTRLPWVQHRSPRWEPEPLRWVGINTVVKMSGAADRYEARTGRADRWRSALARRLTGH